MIYKKKWPLIIFLLPSLIFLIVFLYIPFFNNIKNSLFDMTTPVLLDGQVWKFIGIDNYRRMLTDPDLRIAIWNSLKMMFLTIIFQVGIAFILAVLVSNIRKMQQFFRTVYFFPVVISATAIGLIFKLFYNYNGGMLNQILETFGQEPVNWLKPTLAFIMVAIPTLWSYVGFYFVIILTGLSDIPDEIYEVASIDGCSKFKQVFYITIPMLRGVICTCVVWVLVPNGAPQGLTHFLGTYMYQSTFGMNNYDYGSALAVLIVILGIVVSRVVNTIVQPDKDR